MHLYGKETIKRNRLALTDDDHAEYGPFDSCISTIECYKNSKHMLCVFHALVMNYHSDVYPKLPHTGTKNKVLTNTGEAYGAYSIIFYSYCTPNWLTLKIMITPHNWLHIDYTSNWVSHKLVVTPQTRDYTPKTLL